MKKGDPVYMTRDGRFLSTGMSSTKREYEQFMPLKKPTRLQRLKWFIGRKFNIKRWQPKEVRPFLGIATSAGDSEGWVSVSVQSTIINGSPVFRDEYIPTVSRASEDTEAGELTE